MSKLVLYTFELSIWSAAAELAIAELGLTDKIEAKQVDLAHGENFNPSFVKINENASLPTLVDPEGKVYKTTTEVINYLVTLSSEKVAGPTEVTKLIHEDSIDPNLAFLSARDDVELSAKSGAFPGVFVEGRHKGLTQYASSPDAAPFKSLYEAKLASSTFLNTLLVTPDTAPVESKTTWFTQSQALWANIEKFYLETLPAKLKASNGSGPFLSGSDRPGVDDFHVGAWVAHLHFLFGATKSEEGLQALEKGFSGKKVPAEIVEYWNAWSIRDSWKSVYAKTLH